MTNPKISVIIPLYNKEPYVRRAINSVLSQTLDDFELIVINDGSTDRGASIISEYTDPRIHLINQENRGLTETRNRGIREATAAIISFLDADDEWHPEFLETIFRMYTDYPNGGIYATSYEICINKHVKKHTTPSLGENFEGIIQSYFSVATEFPFVSICVGIPKYVFEKCGYFNPTSQFCEDNEMWTKIALHYPVVYSSKVCARYYKYIKGQMTQRYYSMPEDPIKVFVSSLSQEYLLSCSRYTSNLMSYVDYMVLLSAYFNIGAGDMKSARNLCRSINSDELQSKKQFLFIIATILPGFIGKMGVKIVNNVQYLYKILTWDKVNDCK